MPTRPTIFTLLRVAAALALTPACGDPVHDQQVEALGPEDPQVRPGPHHRPGQPCLVCHGESGPASLMSVAGTVFRDQVERLPVAGVEVLLVDADGTTYQARSNCAGNFFLYAVHFAPRLPLWTTLRRQGRSIDMESPMYKDGDCASCHTDPANPRSAGHIYLEHDPTRFASIPVGRCP